MRRHSKPWTAVQRGVAEAVKSAGGTAVAVIDSVADVVGAVLRDSGIIGATLVGAAAQIAEQAVRGAAKVGGEMGSVAHGFLLGLLRATKETGEEALVTITHAASCFIKQTGALGLDCAGAATGLVEGAIAMSQELGLDAAQAAAAAAQGALEAAYDVGATAGDKVRDALKGTIAGVKIVIKEPFRSHGR